MEVHVADIDWEPGHFAREPGGQAICGAPFAHPFSASFDAAWVECRRCLELMRRDTLPAVQP